MLRRIRLLKIALLGTLLALAPSLSGPVAFRIPQHFYRPAYAASTHTQRTYTTAATTCTAGATVTGSTIDNTTVYGGKATAVLTNGGTGPTVAAIILMQVSSDSFTTNTEVSRKVCTVTASAVCNFSYEVTPGVMYHRIVFTCGTVQNQTITLSYFHELTTI